MVAAGFKLEEENENNGNIENGNSEKNVKGESEKPPSQGTYVRICALIVFSSVVHYL